MTTNGLRITPDRKQLCITPSDAAIRPEVAIWEGMTLIHFEDEPYVYLDMEEVVKFHEREWEDSGRKGGHPIGILVFRSLLSQFRGGSEDFQFIKPPDDGSDELVTAAYRQWRLETSGEIP